MMDRKVVQGMCGWTDQTLISSKKFYPKSSKTGSDKLRYYSSHGLFGCVEIDSTTYAIPNKINVESWVSSTPDNFVFHVKAFGMLCNGGIDASHLPNDIKLICCQKNGWITFDMIGSELEKMIWDRFNDSIEPIYIKCKLGVTVFQFQSNFVPCEKSREYLAYCSRMLSSKYHLCFDFRCRLWINETNLSNTIELLKSLRPEGIVLAASDDYEHEMKPNRNEIHEIIERKVRLPIVFTSKSSNLCGYARIHRRVGSDRLLRESELLEWSQRINKILMETIDSSYCNSNEDSNSFTLKGPIYIMWATDFEDQPIQNAKNILNYLPKDIIYDWKNSLMNKQSKSPDIKNYFKRTEIKNQSSSPDSLICSTNNDKNKRKKLSDGNLLSYFVKI